MAELEPPEVPIELDVKSSQSSETKKSGFLKNLFSKKKSEQNQDFQNQNNMESLEQDFEKANMEQEIPNADFNLPPLSDLNSQEPREQFPELPPLTFGKKTSLEKNKKLKNGKKINGKKSNGQSFSKSYEKVNLKDKLNWTESIEEQTPAIEDSNRSNQDVVELLNKAKQQFTDQQKMTKNNVFLSNEELHENKTELPQIPEFPPLETGSLNSFEEAEKSEHPVQQDFLRAEMPQVNPEISQHFRKLEKQHQKLRDQLNKKINNPKFSMNKQEAMHLLKEYDEKIEEKIENKENELDGKLKRLQELNMQLNKKEKAVNQMKSYLSKTDKLLKEKESKMNQMTTENISAGLNKKLKKEKLLLNNELKKTMELNRQLERKLSVVEKDRKAFEKKRDALLSDEQNKLTSMQTIYEKKLFELTTERTEFEKRRNSSMSLLKQADKINNELKQVSSMKQAIESDKVKIKKELITDKKLKEAIMRAEKHLKKEKESLEKRMFDKYLESRLREITPDSLKKEDSFEPSREMPEIYNQIDKCREAIDLNKITDAKKIYNRIKHLFESTEFEPREKSILFNTVREIYNDIQLKTIDAQNQM